MASLQQQKYNKPVWHLKQLSLYIIVIMTHSADHYGTLHYMASIKLTWSTLFDSLDGSDDSVCW